MEYLYHGSTISGLKILEPRKRFTPAGKIEYATVYASPLAIVAAAHSFPWASDEGIDFKISDKSELELLVPKLQAERLDQPISIYTVSAEHFRPTTEDETGLTYHTEESVEVLGESAYPSATEAIKVLGGTITLI